MQNYNPINVYKGEIKLTNPKKEFSVIELFLQGLSIEERDSLNETIKLMEDNTFYESEIISKFEDNEGNIISTQVREVKVYKRILRDSTVENKLLISFGGYCEYALDQRFIRDRLKSNRSLRIDIGRNEVLPKEEMTRLLEEIQQALKERDIEIEEDYRAIGESERR